MIVQLSYLALLTAFGLAVVGFRSGSGWDRVFKTGPMLLVPIVLLWAAISSSSCPHEAVCREQWWRIAPFYGFLAIGALWLWALLRFHGDRDLYWYYAILFAPGFYFFCMLQMAFAIRFPL
jgi:hypothetical protein